MTDATGTDLRVCYHGVGPVRATAWWIFADGSTGEHIHEVRATSAEAIAAVRKRAANQQADVAAPSSSP